jgi:hypothetical protein
MTTLTERDLALIQIGLPPIDITPPRELTESEYVAMSHVLRERVNKMRRDGYVPMVENGCLFYKNR